MRKDFYKLIRKMFHPEIKGYMYQLPGNDEIQFDITALENRKPEDPSDVELQIVFCIGEQRKKGDSEFTAHVVTANRVSQLKDKSCLIIIPYYDSWESVQEKINEIIFETTDDSWESFCERISEHLCWEYDYKK